MRVDASRTLTSKVSGSSLANECRSSLNSDLACPTGTAMGLELVLNLLAPDAHDRYFWRRMFHPPAGFRGEMTLQADACGRVATRQDTLETRPAGLLGGLAKFETISHWLGFGGRVTQGSAIMALEN